MPTGILLVVGGKVRGTNWYPIYRTVKKYVHTGTLLAEAVN